MTWTRGSLDGLDIRGTGTASPGCVDHQDPVDDLAEIGPDDLRPGASRSKAIPDARRMRRPRPRASNARCGLRHSGPLAHW